MDKLPPPIRLLVFMFAGWLNQEQQAVIEYLRQESSGSSTTTASSQRPSADSELPGRRSWPPIGTQ